MRRLLIILFLILPAVVYGQNIRVKSFDLVESDLEAKLNPVMDNDGRACALLRIPTALEDLLFSGDFSSAPVYADGEWKIYISSKCTGIGIRRTGGKAIDFIFPEGIEPYHTYDLLLETIDKQATKFFLLPTAAFCASQTSYGAMLGVAKKFGGYISARSSFTPMPIATHECDESGMMQGGFKGWFTGKYEKSRLSITTGGIANIHGGLHAFAGIGYGRRILAWETYDGSYAKVTSASYSGVETEAGIMFTFGKVALSAGISSNNFKHPEAIFSIGILL